MITGKAAHITAAACGGPRYDPTLTREQRRSAENGIWLCAVHADVIDKDERNYSVETLKLFRKQAEARAYEEITQFRSHLATPSELVTLVEIGPDLIFEGFWLGAEKSRWRFQLDRWIIGSQSKLTDYIASFDELPQTAQFIAVESQGDGRELTGPPAWKMSQNRTNATEVEVEVKPLPERRSPHTLGQDLAFSDGDLDLEGSDLKVVSGVENAKQKLRHLLNTPIGGLFYAEGYGVRWRELALKYGKDLHLLERLFKTDLARVISAPVNLTELDLQSVKIVPVTQPQVNFIERVEAVKILSMNAECTCTHVAVHVIWADGQPWQGDFNVTLSDRPERPQPPSLLPPPRF